MLYYILCDNFHEILYVYCCFFLFQLKTLIIYGELDTGLGATSKNNLEKIPNAETFVLKGAKHACYMDKPKEFNEKLLEFLNSLQ